MTQEEMNLVHIDLCGRLPYGLKAMYENEIVEITRASSDCIVSYFKDCQHYGELSINYIKPYLRPLSSMSGDEIYSVAGIVIPGLPHNIDETKGTCSVCCHNYTEEIEQDFSVRDLANGIYGIEGLDWLNEHHFDYRGLIQKGLAITAPEGMYNTKKE